MTKNEYHSILVQLLQQANSDLLLWPPGIAPGTLRTGAIMDDLSHSSLTGEHENPIVAELESMSSEPDSQDFKSRHDEFIRILAESPDSSLLK